MVIWYGIDVSARTLESPQRDPSVPSLRIYYTSVCFMNSIHNMVSSINLFCIQFHRHTRKLSILVPLEECQHSPPRIRFLTAEALDAQSETHHGLIWFDTSRVAAASLGAISRPCFSQNENYYAA